jgi:hypothetical protein
MDANEDFNRRLTQMREAGRGNTIGRDRSLDPTRPRRGKDPQITQISVWCSNVQSNGNALLKEGWLGRIF